MTGVQALDREESSSNHRWRRATAPPGGRERSREQSTMERSSPPEPARALSSKRVTAAADSPAPDSVAGARAPLAWPCLGSPDSESGRA